MTGARTNTLASLRGERLNAIAGFGIADHFRAMGLQPLDQRWNDARYIFATRTRNNSDCLDHFIYAEALSRQTLTLAFVARFHFPDFNHDCQSLNIHDAKWVSVA